MKLCISPSQQNGIEEELIYPISQRLYDRLTEDNFIEVKLLPLFPGRDELALYNAIVASNDWGANFHLSIHADAGKYAKGASGLYYSEAGKNFITPITQGIMDATPWSDVGIRYRGDLGELKNTNAVAGLIELSFYDDSEEYAWMQNNGAEIVNLLRLGIYKALNINVPESDPYKKKYEDLLNQYYSFKADVIALTEKYL